MLANIEGARLIHPPAGRSSSAGAAARTKDSIHAPADSTNDALVEFYRAPSELLRCAASNEPRPGSFTTVSDLLGKLACNIPEEALLDTDWDGSEVVEYLRCERYMNDGNGAKPGMLSGKTLRNIYYAVRPALPVFLRKHLQRVFHREWEKIAFPNWPVDTTVENVIERRLVRAMKTRGIKRIPFIWFWPKGASSCAMVTHDVETKAGLNFVDRLMDIDDSFGIKSSFQLIPETHYLVSKELRKRIAGRGFEVNVQDLSHDKDLFRDKKEFLQKARAINQYIQAYDARGFRSGRMYRNADWLNALEVSYDMSIPNVAHLEPQRGGCCTVFPFFIGRILELPLTTIQDYGLFHILGDYSIELWKKQTGLIAEKHGLASFIVHPDYIRTEKALAAYKNLLGHLSRMRRQEKAWIALPKEIDRWWRERSKMTLTNTDGVWTIKGKGRERGVVAYATVSGDKIAYTV